MKPARWLSILLALSAPALAEAPAPPNELIIYYFERMPFFGDRDGKAAGRLIDVTRLILKEAAVPYRFVNVPVVRFFDLLKKPGNSCLAGAHRTKERETIYAYSDDFIYRDQPFRIVVNKARRKALPDRPTIR